MNNQPNVTNFGNILMKNETLKNMLTKFSDEAKRQSSGNERNNIKNEIFLSRENEFYEDKEDHLNQNLFGDDNFNNKVNNNINNFFNKGINVNQFNNKFQDINDQKEPTNENFTQEYYRERYKNFIPSNTVYPSNFLHESNKNNINKFNHNSGRNSNQSVVNIYLLIQSKFQQELTDKKLREFSILNWLNIYNALNVDIKITLNSYSNNFSVTDKYLLQKLENFFVKYCFNSDKEIVIAQICQIKHIDCLQILELKDFELLKKEVIVTSEELNENFSINHLMKDNQFSLNEVILIKKEEMKELKLTRLGGDSNCKKMFMVSMQSISQLFKFN